MYKGSPAASFCSGPMISAKMMTLVCCKKSKVPWWQLTLVVQCTRPIEYSSVSPGKIVAPLETSTSISAELRLAGVQGTVSFSESLEVMVSVVTLSSASWFLNLCVLP